MPSGTWSSHVEPGHLYFITMSAVRRARVFRRDVIRRILVDSLNTGRILGQYELFAFVIMPNHIHTIVRCLKDYGPGDVVREFKKATANLIVRQYEAEGNQAALSFLADCVAREGKHDYAVWRDEYQAKNVFSPGFLRQKVDYIHGNPVQPHWALTESPEEYVWSSARYYLTRGRAVIPLTDVGELLT